MTHSLNRRALIKGAPTVLAAATLPTIATASNGDDAELFAALKRWQDSAIALKKLGDALDGETVNYKEKQAEFDEAVMLDGKVMIEAIETPARTLEGLKAKLKLIQDAKIFGDFGFHEETTVAGNSILADVERILGPLPAQFILARV